MSRTRTQPLLPLLVVGVMTAALLAVCEARPGRPTGSPLSERVPPLPPPAGTSSLLDRVPPPPPGGPLSLSLCVLSRPGVPAPSVPAPVPGQPVVNDG
ncbi:PX domain-containing protein kinase-like protein [Amphibalanus amphitrite]|uniref:PX domain-containing protein kinase-like protein n=1 Tax=Amphibalanus amphitrite TaxID=1232801 RepID=UPI001C92B4F5|nr:PX domain-containing protein kinase-like protein [Amphibalanus amphitrite]